MDLELPPTIAVTRLLRAQRARKKAYRDWFDMAYERDWKEEKRAGKPTGAWLETFAREYEQQLVAAGGVEIVRDGTPDRLRLRGASGYAVQGQAFWPIGLAQNISIVDDAYAEDALMLVRLGGGFAPNKVVGHEAPLNLCLTRHSMERLVERGGVTGDLGDALVEGFSQLASDTALALAFGIAKERDEDGEWGRTAFVPFGEGLVVFTNRLVAAQLTNQDIGWRFSFTKRRYTWGYLKKNLILPDTSEQSCRANGLAVVSLWFGTTYLSLSQLTFEQRCYSEAFRAFRSSCPSSILERAFRVQLDPDFTYRAAVAGAEGGGRGGGVVEPLRRMVEGDAFKMHRREKLAYLIDADTSSRELRQKLRQSR